MTTKMETEKFIIVSASQEKPEYYSIDNTSGGYPWWASYFGSAKFFDGFDKAKDELASDLFTRMAKMSNGSIHPPHMIHSALNLSNDNPSASGELKIFKIVLEEVYSTAISGSILPSEKEVKRNITDDEWKTIQALRQGTAKVHLVSE
jgi:hypothetical protein